MSYILQALSGLLTLYILLSSGTKIVPKPVVVIIFVVSMVFAVVGISNFSSYPISEMSSMQWLILFIVPIGSWSGSIVHKVIVMQHGEESLHRKYGPPKVDPTMITDQKLLMEYKISRATQVGIFAVTLLYFALRAAKVAT